MWQTLKIWRVFFLVQGIRKRFTEELTVDLNLKELGRIYMIAKRCIQSNEYVQNYMKADVQRPSKYHKQEKLVTLVS